METEMGTKDLISSLCSVCAGVDGVNGPKQWAECLINFSVETSKEVLRIAGFKEVNDSELKPRFNDNMLADKYPLPDGYRPPDVVHEYSLWLVDVSSSLDTWESDLKIRHEFVFCKTRVIDWDDKNSRVRRVLTYEETARFIVFWFAENILRIIRKNRWDRIQQLPDLYDRLATFWVKPS
jgi:hypothetical protein